MNMIGLNGDQGSGRTVAFSFRGIGEALLIIAVVGYPLVTIPATIFDLPSRWVTVPYRLLVVVLASVLLLWALNRKGRRLKIAWWMLPFGLFWGLYLLRLGIDTIDSPIHLSRPLWEYWAYALGTGMLPALGLAVASGEILVSRMRRVMTAALAFTLVGLILIGPGLDSIGDGRFYLNPFLNPISGAHYAVMFFLVALWFVVVGRDRSVTGISVLVLATVCMFWVQTLSASRGPLVVLGLGVGLIAATSFGVRRMFRGGVAIVLSVLAFLGFQALLPFRFRPMAALERLILTGDRIGGDQEARVSLWASAWEQFLQSPLLGAGLEDPSFPGYPHNIIVEAFLSTGILGGTCMAFLILLTLGQATYWVLVDDQKGWLGLVGIQMLIWALFSGALYARPETWAMMGLILGWKSPTVTPQDGRRGARPRTYSEGTGPDLPRSLPRSVGEH